jgi:PIN domain nuclease of toxin-antitoxin system
MRYLLDTHIFLWWVLDNPKLSEPFKKAIAHPDNDLYLSSASTWEMVIKASIGKLSLPSSPETFIRHQLLINEMTPLDISIEHTFALATLPMIHKDPFDRILIAQAIYENLVLMTDDPLIKNYKVKLFS